MIHRIRTYFEMQGFEVCSRMGDRLHMRASSIRLFFIYSSFIALGSPLIIYMSLAFLLKLKDYVYTRRTSVFDL
ncbi:MAG: PspC domain-containing protein [Bacteroidota bacterium]|nr:PspC domain-containing protein [Bacteroidota bacterium]MDX5426733.1 PspC domain-containing protein [Bacteroidota bacterium]MDX5447193.1 PspC domain-containing protein [Bacteroidota bacterium]MDX5504725.1 PspC domain-containing protein [Bacteroidota bacterium]